MKINFDNIFYSFEKAVLTIAICALVVLVGYLLGDAWINHRGWLIAGIGVFFALVVFFYIREERQDKVDADNGYRQYISMDELAAQEREMEAFRNRTK